MSRDYNIRQGIKLKKRKQKHISLQLLLFSALSYNLPEHHKHIRLVWKQVDIIQGAKMLNPPTIHSMPSWETFSHLVVKKEGKNKQKRATIQWDVLFQSRNVWL